MAIEVCIVTFKAWAYCILHVLHTVLNTIEVYLIYFSQESYLCPFIDEETEAHGTMVIRC